ncbi:MAG: HAMP domain-containing histidine kinase [Deltaproteobacteria bacterium]|nr:HAMP domain-containing histidine kinase [Deltaproteobacteria bacterium]
MDPAEEIRKRELLRIVQPFVRLRSVVLSAVLASVGLTIVLAAGATPPRMFAFGVALGLALAITLVDRPRIKRAGALTNPAFEIAIGVAAQTVIISITGLADSPFLAILAIVSVINGLAMGRTPGGFRVLGFASFALWVVVGLSLLADPAWPAFFEPVPASGFAFDACLLRGCVTQLMILASFAIGSVIRVAMIRMIDEALRAREQLVMALGERNQELLRMSGAIAHELKNPLASIQGLVQLLERGDENRAKRFAVLRREVGRMRGTVDGFLSFSRPLDSVTVEELDVAAVFDELTLIHEGLLAERKISVERELSATRLIRADGRKVRQALTNLLQNAIEATPAGGTISWIAQNRGDGVAIGVKDSGPGIADEIKERVGRVGVTTKKDGSGIGLVVAKSIAEQHGGRLVLESSRERGLLALLELPSDHVPV